jgi:hypothetical protein
VTRDQSMLVLVRIVSLTLSSFYLLRLLSDPCCTLLHSNKSKRRQGIETVLG